MADGAWIADPDVSERWARWDRSMEMLRRTWSLVSSTPAMRTVAAASLVAWLIATLVLFGPVFAWWVQTGERWVLVAGGAAAAYPFVLVTVYFNVALLAAANACMDGERLTVRRSFAIATRRLPQIAGWALLAAGVGAALDALAEWFPGAGAIAAWVLGAAWSVATLFAVPVIAVDGLGGRAAARRSAQIFRGLWGETLIGFLSITFCLIVLALPGGILLCAGAVAGTGPVALAVMGVGFVLLAVASFVGFTVERVYGLVLYRYVLEGQLHAGFTESDLRSGVFFKDPRRRWYRRRPVS